MPAFAAGPLLRLGQFDADFRIFWAQVCARERGMLSTLLTGDRGGKT